MLKISNQQLYISAINGVISGHSYEGYINEMSSLFCKGIDPELLKMLKMISFYMDSDQ